MSLTFPLTADLQPIRTTMTDHKNSFYIKQVLNFIALNTLIVLNSKELSKGKRLNKFKLQGTVSSYLQQSIALDYGEQQKLLASWLQVKSLVLFLTIIHLQGTSIPCLSCGGNKVWPLFELKSFGEKDSPTGKINASQLLCLSSRILAGTESLLPLGCTLQLSLLINISYWVA